MEWIFLFGTNHVPFMPDGYFKVGVEKEKWFGLEYTDWQKQGWDFIVTIFRVSVNFGQDF